MFLTFDRLLKVPRRPLPHHAPLAVLVALLSVACGSSAAKTTGDDSGLPTRTAQTALTQDAWQALVTADTALAALATAQTQPWQAAGEIVAADGTTLDWAEFAPAVDAPRTQVAAVFRSCPKAGDTPPVCVRGKGTYTATGVTLTDDGGKPLTLVPVGAPQAWEWETSTNLKNDNTTITAGLTGDSAPLDLTTVQAQFSAIVPQKRRFVLLSAYGKQVGVDGTPITDAATRTGRFDSVETIEFVRQTDVETLLPSLTALDTVVWLGAGVQQKPSKASPPTKAVGMNVTRGIFGDEVYYGTLAAPLLDTPPLGGPGLIVLAGQNTFLGDISDKQSLAAVWYGPATRPVVGFSLPLGTPGASGYTHLALGDVIGATVKLIGALGDGQTLDAALTTASAGQAFTLTSPMATDNRKKWTWTAANSSFWPKQPSSGTLTIEITLTPSCVQPVATCDMAGWQAGTKAANIINTSISIVCDNPAFVGPYFTCTGGDSQPPGTKFDVTGVLRGTNAADHLLFFAVGTAGGPLGSAAIAGDGVLVAGGIDKGGGTTTYNFNGQADLSFYTDASGNCCFTQVAQLVGVSASTYSSLQLHN